MDDRKLTFIIVPHGDLDTKTIEVPYRRLKALLLVLAVVVLGLSGMVGTWWYYVMKASRVRELETQLSTLERERAKVDSLAHVLADVETQYERVREMLGADGPAAGKAPLLPELPKGGIVDDDGDGVADSAAPAFWPLTQRGYVTRGSTKAVNGNDHPGIDIAVPQNAYILAAGPGVVKISGQDPVYGKYIVITHGGGLESLYGHASTLLVQKGAKVTKQQLIALAGSTGQSTAPHLHFEIRRGGRPVDPFQYVRQP